MSLPKIRTYVSLLAMFLLCQVCIACGNSNKAIDVVYTWVDGNDADWQTMKQQRALECNKEIIHSDANSNNRFRDRNELKYSLRALRQNAPFVNHIYIVTMGQRPSWLGKHDKITVVDHKEIFKNIQNLPTFNSHAIESNLYRIPHLNEYFIYFTSPDTAFLTIFIKYLFNSCGLQFFKRT